MAEENPLILPHRSIAVAARAVRRSPRCRHTACGRLATSQPRHTRWLRPARRTALAIAPCWWASPASTSASARYSDVESSEPRFREAPGSPASPLFTQARDARRRRPERVRPIPPMRSSPWASRNAVPGSAPKRLLCAQSAAGRRARDRARALGALQSSRGQPFPLTPRCLRISILGRCAGTLLLLTYPRSSVATSSTGAVSARTRATFGTLGSL